MKQRITYLVEDPDSFDPEQLQVQDGSLLLKRLQGVQEHRATFSLDELPSEVLYFASILSWMCTPVVDFR